MVVISPALDLPIDILSLFYTTDPALSNAPVLIFYGPSTTATANAASSSRIQSHVFTPAGLQSYPRLSVSPSSSLYSAVNCLSREEQGDGVCRGLAFSLFKYFTDLSEVARDTWIQQSLSTKEASTALKLFHESHAASLASQMVKAEDPRAVLEDLRSAFSEYALSHLDLDVVLPPGSIKQLEDTHEEPEDGYESIRYGCYAPLIKLLGEAAFIPTSRLRRAPSRATSINRSKVLAKSQKESIRREMCELIDTEERYVGKLYDLVHSVAADFREKAKNKIVTSTSPSESALTGLFPPCLDHILLLNSDFLEAARKILEETESAAIEDIQLTDNKSSHANHSNHSKAADPTGTVALASCLLEWLPKFKDSYGLYIRAHSQFSSHLKIFIKETGSSFARRVEETGEQRLMSMLIEPIQRLPRYSLYIDNIVKHLPFRHPAIKPLLTAKDIVADICSQDETSSPQSKVLERLRRFIPSWPSEFKPNCRLVSVLDAIELKPPFRQEVRNQSSDSHIILLFGGYLVTTRKVNQGSISARALLSELENPTIETKYLQELTFRDYVKLDDIDVCEMDGNSMVMITPLNKDSSLLTNAKSYIKPKADSQIRIFYLKGVYERRASRWTSEIVKARVEGRFSESERENWKWEARSLENSQIDLGLFCAIFEDEAHTESISRGELATIRIMLDPKKGSRKLVVGDHGISVLISVSIEGQGFFKIEIEAANERGTRDMVTTAEFVPVLIRRLSNILQQRYQLRNPVMTLPLLRYYRAILTSLNVSSSPALDTAKMEGTPFRSRSIRPISPVKMLSNLFSSNSVKETSPNKPLPEAPTLARDTNKTLPIIIRSRSNAGAHLVNDSEDVLAKKTLMPGFTEEFFKDPLQSLEETLSAYILALHSRKGNIVGRVVSARAMADESAVNELYNSLLETPSSHELAAQVSVDVLFAAFENFLKVAWLDKMGPVMHLQMLLDLQTKSETLNPMDFDEFLTSAIAEMAPQNQRALKAIVKLLVDLLDGTTSDGDRGALTAAIAEIVVIEGNALDYISLFDRLVAEQDIVLGNDARALGGTTIGDNSTISSTGQSGQVGSISSKASSMSKKFGFGSLKRSNSRGETTSKTGSILRGLSRSSRPNETPFKTPLNRAKSFDLKGEMRVQSRPASRDSSLMSKHPTQDNAAPGTPKAASPISSKPKKKRRSSLSDLKLLPAPDVSPFWTSSTLGDFQMPTKLQHEPKTPSKTSKGLVNGAHLPYEPQAITKKENSPPVSQRLTSTHSQSSITSTPPRPTSMIIVSGSPSSKCSPTQHIPKGILSERLGSGNAQPASQSHENMDNKPGLPKSPQKLKMASPRKLKERLQVQQQAIESAGDSLKEELDKIAEELATFNTRPNSMLVRSGSASPEKRNQGTIANLNNRLRALEAKFVHELRNLGENSAALSEEFRSSVMTSQEEASRWKREYEAAMEENKLLKAKLGS